MTSISEIRNGNGKMVPFEPLHSYESPERWQMISRNTDDIIAIIRGDQTWLSTVDLTFHIGGYNYESCIFMNNESSVLCRYKTQEEAIKGHNELAKEYNLV